MTELLSILSCFSGKKVGTLSLLALWWCERVRASLYTDFDLTRGFELEEVPRFLQNLRCFKYHRQLCQIERKH